MDLGFGLDGLGEGEAGGSQPEGEVGEVGAESSSESEEEEWLPGRRRRRRVVLSPLDEEEEAAPAVVDRLEEEGESEQSAADSEEEEEGGGGRTGGLDVRDLPFMSRFKLLDELDNKDAVVDDLEPRVTDVDR